MTTKVTENHSGELVREYTCPENALDVVALYVSRGFDLAQALPGNGARLTSGRAEVIVRKLEKCG